MSEATAQRAEHTARIEVYDGYHDHVPRRDPQWSVEVDVYTDDYWGGSPRSPPHDADTAYLSERIEYHSGAVSFHVDTDTPVWLFVHTNDSYHDPDDWNRPVEHGLVYGPDIDESAPFGCEVWGRVVVWAADRERGAR